jgi:16S rRNA (uracil1498-N3)-methyltransferase
MSNHRRFFIEPSQIENGTARITGDAARQIGKVLRLKEGDFICLLDGSGNEHDALITAITRDAVTARILGTGSCAREPALTLSLALCLPKGDKVELIIGKCAELGISRYVIVSSERTIARVESARLNERLTRWRKIAAEAAEQCGRAVVPEIKGMVAFADLVGLIAEHDLALIAWEEEGGVSLRQTLRTNSDAKSVLLIVGPEGGLTEAEVEMAKCAGAKSVSLGKRLLRVETAAISAVAVIMYEMEGEL